MKVLNNRGWGGGEGGRGARFRILGGGGGGGGKGGKHFSGCKLIGASPSPLISCK